MSNDQEILDFCRNIRCLRKIYRLTQKQMAEILGCSVRSVSMLEHGKLPEMLGASVILRASRYFHISSSELFVPIENWLGKISCPFF